MNLSTLVPSPAYPFHLDFQSKLLCIGSCFSDNVGQRLENLKFSCSNNPAGILFNPSSIFRLLHLALNGDSINESHIIHRDGLYFHLDYHSQIYATTKEALIEKLISTNQKIGKQLLDIDLCVITMGTAWAYEKDGIVIANCQKLPANQFTKKLLELHEMQEQFDRFYTSLKDINPSCNILFTVSPIRHWKEGATDNQVSKSILHLLKHELCNRYKNVFYFPSYEILMDELRDYRFYSEDLLHPSKMAFEHIWERFSSSLLDKKTLKTAKAIQKLLIGLNHTVLYPEAESHLKHLNHLKKEILALQSQNISLTSELELIQSKIEALNRP